MSAKPHISPALLALRGWVTAAAVIVASASVAHLLTFALVRYTEVRTVRIEGQPNQAIIVPKPAAAAPPVPDAEQRRIAANRSAPLEPTDANLVRSVTDRNLELANAALGALGLISLIVLVGATGLGAALVSAGAVPGVEVVVRAFVWSCALLGLGIPWADLAGPTMFDGVFCSYSTLVSAAERGPGAAIIAHVVVPTLMLIMASLAGWWFRRGVVAGMILTSLSEVDEALEREMATIRERGVGRLNPGGRNAEVLQTTLAPERVAVPEAPMLRKAAGAERLSLTERDAPKRPI